MLVPSQKDIARFERYVSPEPNSGCWLWLGAANQKGRGTFSYGGRRPKGRVELHHRFAYLVEHGDIPEGLSVLHRCDVPLCCNPAHLFVGTQADNVSDMMEKGRHRLTAVPLANSEKSHCLHGHPLNGDNLWIRADGSRICKACRARIARNYRSKTK